MRQLAPRDPDPPAEQLAHDPEQSVRRAVAAHRNLPTQALTELLDDDEWVAFAAARSPFLPLEQMTRLVDANQ